MGKRVKRNVLSKDPTAVRRLADCQRSPGAKVVLPAGTTNHKLISTDLDRANGGFGAANLAGPIGITSTGGIGFGEPARFAYVTPGHYGVQTDRDLAVVTSHAHCVV